MTTTERRPLTRERIIEAAVAFADEHGIDALSMRKLGQVLGVEAMSLYNHVAGKDDILDGMVQHLFAGIGPIDTAGDWKVTARAAATAAKNAFAAHEWAVPLISTRETTSEASFGIMDVMIGMLLADGYDPETAHHAWHVIASHVLGYAFQEANSVFGRRDDQAREEAEQLLREYGRIFPNLAAVATYLMECSHDEEFQYGLDIILSGIEARKPA